jgi:hypothetical protein
VIVYGAAIFDGRGAAIAGGAILTPISEAKAWYYGYSYTYPTYTTYGYYGGYDNGAVAGAAIAGGVFGLMLGAMAAQRAAQQPRYYAAPGGSVGQWHLPGKDNRCYPYRRRPRW